MFCPLKKSVSREPSEKTQRPSSHVCENRQYLSNDFHPFRIVLNEVDFRSCIVKARKENGQKALGVDEWIQPNTVFHFVFCDSEYNRVAFEGIHTAVSNTKHEDHIIDAKWRSLHEYFGRNQEVLKRTCGLARELVEARARADQQLREEPVIVEIEDVEEEEKEDWDDWTEI